MRKRRRSFYQLPEVDLVKDLSLRTTRPDKISENEEIL